MLNVLLLNGSPHKNGCTFTALSEVAGQLNKQGIETNIFHIGAGPIHGCIACYKCAQTGHCAFTDDPVNEAIDLLKKADGLVLGLPFIMPLPAARCARSWTGCSSENQGLMLINRPQLS